MRELFIKDDKDHTKAVMDNSSSDGDVPISQAGDPANLSVHATMSESAISIPSVHKSTL